MVEISPEYLASQGLSETFPERFWAKVKKTDSCWLWIGGCKRTGYGRLNKKGKKPKIDAHRASWIIHKGPIPEGVYVLHDCPNGDNPACVNPDHLWLGTHEQNMHDKVAKHVCCGENHYHRKLSWLDVCYIRNAYILRQRTQIELGKMFGIATHHVSEIINFKKWNHGMPSSSPPGVPKML